MNKDLAKKGRFGDTEIRKVDGQPAHVSKDEAKFIDRKGLLGEIVVKSMGSGTINPETVQMVTLLAGAWIVGDSLRVTE